MESIATTNQYASLVSHAQRQQMFVSTVAAEDLTTSKDKSFCHKIFSLCGVTHEIYDIGCGFQHREIKVCVTQCTERVLAYGIIALTFARPGMATNSPRVHLFKTKDVPNTTEWQTQVPIEGRELHP